MDQEGVIPGRPDVPGHHAAETWRPPELNLAVEHPADARVLAAALVAGLVVDLAVRSDGVGAAEALLVAVVAGCMLASGRIRNPQAAALVLAAPAFGAWMLFRESPWLLPLDALAAALLLVVAASIARGGSLLDLSPVPLLARAGHAVMHGIAAPAFVGAPVRTAWRGRARTSSGGRIARGVAIAVPVLAVVGALLGSADPVFASWLTFPGSPAEIAAHVCFVAAGAWGLAALLRVASARPPVVPEVEPPRLGAVESLVVLAGLDVLFAAFVAAQVVSAAGGAHRVLATRGLTYAAYARSGFFQLVAVAVITLIVLLVLRTVTPLESRRARVVFVALAVAAVVLTLAIVGVAIHRMHLYERAFGLTMLRLHVEVASVAIGVAFVAVALRLAGVRARRAWLTPVLIAIVLASVLALDVLNPEAVVARTDMERAVRTGRIDVNYLSTLSADATPALVALAVSLPHADRRDLRERLCGEAARLRFHGWPAWNRSRVHALDALARFCVP